MATTGTPAGTAPAPVPEVNSIPGFPQNTTWLTQANLSTTPIRVPDVVHRLSFDSPNIRRLTAADFTLESVDMIRLKYDDCILILFYVENTESYQLANIWAVVAQQVAGPIFAAINMLSERKVAEAFTRLKSSGSTPIHWASLRQYPFIMVYREGWPVAVYNGERSVQSLIDFALTLACQAGYYEITQVNGSMQAEVQLEMGPAQPYLNTPEHPREIRTESRQYTTQVPIRGFNPNLAVAAAGSKEAATEAKEVMSEEQRAGTSGELTPVVENAAGLPSAEPAADTVHREP